MMTAVATLDVLFSEKTRWEIAGLNPVPGTVGVYVEAEIYNLPSVQREINAGLKAATEKLDASMKGWTPEPTGSAQGYATSTSAVYRRGYRK